jgi:hypothetical protein
VQLDDASRAFVVEQRHLLLPRDLDELRDGRRLGGSRRCRSSSDARAGSRRSRSETASA